MENDAFQEHAPLESIVFQEHHKFHLSFVYESDVTSSNNLSVKRTKLSHLLHAKAKIFDNSFHGLELRDRVGLVITIPFTLSQFAKKKKSSERVTTSPTLKGIPQ